MVLLNRLRHSLLASVLLSCHCILLSMLKNWLRRWKRLVLKHIWLTLVGTVLVNVSLSAILVVSSMLFWMALLIRLLLRLFLTSISLFLQNCRVLIRRSLILVTLTLTLLSGMKKQKTWLVVSSRTSLSSLVTKQVRNWLLPVRNCNLNFTDLTYKKWFHFGKLFLFDN